jgi:hypothetical protein
MIKCGDVYQELIQLVAQFTVQSLKVYYVCVCVYTYIHAYIHTYIHTYIHGYIRTYMHTCIHAYIRAYTQTFRAEPAGVS